jgi:hypothetical protein
MAKLHSAHWRPDDPVWAAWLTARPLPKSSWLTLTAAKTVKGESRGFLTAILYLAPAQHGVCPWATEACKAVCLGETSGRMAMDGSRAARARRTAAMLADPATFWGQIAAEIRRLEGRARKRGLTLCARLNGTSDLTAPPIAMARAMPHLQFYDYTKEAARMVRPRPRNYHLTYSLPNAEPESIERARRMLAVGQNVAVVFSALDIPKGAPMIETWRGMPVVDADTTDLRFLDPPGTLAGLRAKGRLKKRTDFELFVRA